MDWSASGKAMQVAIRFRGMAWLGSAWLLYVSIRSNFHLSNCILMHWSLRHTTFALLLLRTSKHNWANALAASHTHSWWMCVCVARMRPHFWCYRSDWLASGEAKSPHIRKPTNIVQLWPKSSKFSTNLLVVWALNLAVLAVDYQWDLFNPSSNPLYYLDKMSMHLRWLRSCARSV